MQDLALATGRSYALVTTAVQRARGDAKLAQFELHLPAGDLRLQFLDRPSLARFCFALGELARDVYIPEPRRLGPYVRTRLYTDRDKTVGTTATKLLIDDVFGLPF